MHALSSLQRQEKFLELLSSRDVRPFNFFFFFGLSPFGKEFFLSIWVLLPSRVWWPWWRGEVVLGFQDMFWQWEGLKGGEGVMVVIFRS